MNQLLLDLKSQYDIVMFDAPPALLVTDANILARMVDTSMIVVAHQETKMDNLNKVQKAIKNVGGNVAGVVINKIPTSVKKYQDSYYGEYYGNPQDMVKTKKSSENFNQDLYLRGKATILDDRNKKKNYIEESEESDELDFNDNDEDISDRDTVESLPKALKAQKVKQEDIPMSQTEEMLKRMNKYLEEQKRKMNN